MVHSKINLLFICVTKEQYMIDLVWKNWSSWIPRKDVIRSPRSFAWMFGQLFQFMEIKSKQKELSSTQVPKHNLRYHRPIPFLPKLPLYLWSSFKFPFTATCILKSNTFWKSVFIPTPSSSRRRKIQEIKLFLSLAQKR